MVIGQRTALIALLTFVVVFCGHVMTYGLGTMEEMAQAIAFGTVSAVAPILATLQGKPEPEEDDDITEEDVAEYQARQKED